MGFGLRMGHYSVKNNSATKKSFQNNKFSFLISLILVKGFRPQQQPIQLPFSMVTSHHTSSFIYLFPSDPPTKTLLPDPVLKPHPFSPSTFSLEIASEKTKRTGPALSNLA